MKKKIAILGSTGSIGKTSLKIIARDKKNFKLELLSAKKNYKLLISQAKKFNVKNIIITDKKYYHIAKNKKIKSINIYNNFEKLSKIFPKKIDYAMCAIVGLDGLSPVLKIIKHTKKIAIANKESIICAWNLIHNALDKHKTQFIPVDSEHFSIWYALKNTGNENINKIYLTASGGPLLNTSNSKIKNINIKEVLKHPNWKMGKKITVDSATMMNKVFEIIEAKNIFNLEFDKLKIIIHPKSYVHAIILFNDGIINLIAHDTTMEIPIFNTIYKNGHYFKKTNNLQIDKINNLNLYKKLSLKKFPSIKVLKLIPKKNSLFETVVVSANDTLVKLYLNKKIKYFDIIPKLLKIISLKEFVKLKKISPKNVSEIINLNKYVHFKITSKSV